MADQIVLVQALHDDHDGATALVVEPAVPGTLLGPPWALTSRRLRRIGDVV
jgi:hypothetical protein